MYRIIVLAVTVSIIGLAGFPNQDTYAATLKPAQRGDWTAPMIWSETVLTDSDKKIIHSEVTLTISSSTTSNLDASIKNSIGLTNIDYINGSSTIPNFNTINNSHDTWNSSIIIINMGQHDIYSKIMNSTDKIFSYPVIHMSDTTSSTSGLDTFSDRSVQAKYTASVSHPGGIIDPDIVQLKMGDVPTGTTKIVATYFHAPIR